MALPRCPYSPADQAAWHRYDLSIRQAKFFPTQILDRPVTGRIFFDQVVTDNLGIGRPDYVGLIFGRHVRRKRPRPNCTNWRACCVRPFGAVAGCPRRAPKP
jgi:hypothetical protein